MTTQILERQCLQFSADRPIKHPSGDKLGYAPFSRMLAKSVCEMAPTEGMVLAINGPWGSGKSSILNFMQHYIKEDYRGSRIVTIQFNPWWFSGRENLTRLLIGQISGALGKQNYQSIRENLATFADLVSAVPGNPVTDLFKQSASHLRKIPDLNSMKEKIDDLLRLKQIGIIVIIDDIDRLAPEEICDLFRTIKAVGNFYGVVYVLSYDVNVVKDSLCIHLKTDGMAYIDKIVQVPFSIPMVDKTNLRKLLFYQLDEVLKWTTQITFDESHWQRVFWESLDYFIDTPRDVARIINALQATYPCVKDEVNPVDFIAMETIRIIFPDLYLLIWHNQSVFFFGTENDRDSFKQVLDEWLSSKTDGEKKPIREVLQSLFPQLDKNIYSNDWVRDWRKEKRICSPEAFPAFFKLSIDDWQISSSDVRQTLTVMQDKREFEKHLLRYSKQIQPNGTSRLRSLLERLEDYTEKEINEEHIPNVLGALFNIGDQLLLESDESQGFFDIGNDLRIGRLVHQLINRIDNLNERGKLVVNAMQNGNAISIIAERTMDWEHRKYELVKNGQDPEKEGLFSPKDLEMISKCTLLKIKQAAESNILLSTPKLKFVLAEWKNLEGEQPVKEWIQSVTRTDKGLLLIVKHFMSIHHTHEIGGYRQERNVIFDPDSLLPYIDKETILSRLKSISSFNCLTTEQTKALRAFVQQHGERR